MPLKSARRKGNRCERLILDMFRGWGFTGRKQPMSGALQDWPCDLHLEAPDGRLLIEVKARKAGIATFTRWLQGADLVALKPDHAEPIFILTAETMERFVKMATAAQELEAAEEAARRIA